jgi:hypothetical protein
MAARSNRPAADTPRVPRAGMAWCSASGRHVIDLTQGPSSEVRMAEYEEAFGLPSALHQHPLPVVVTKRGLGRLRSLTSRRARG